MNEYLGTVTGKVVRHAMRLRKKSGGQAVPGLIIEHLVPNYLALMLRKLPEGVVIITGTNGKTTTTKMVVELLRAEGKRVLTNPTGSNMTRGLMASTAQQASWKSTLPFDIAVFEVDEAYAAKIAEQVQPRYVLGLNVSRDQLDRFGEVDAVARLIGDAMQYVSEGIVVNANDPRLRTIAEHTTNKHGVALHYFSVAPSLRHYFPNDLEIVSTQHTKNEQKDTFKPLVELANFKDKQAAYTIAGKTYQTDLQLVGQHNFQNAAAALALVQCLLPQTPAAQLVAHLADITPPFGRGEIFTLANDSTLQLILVKNPAGFRQALADPPKTATMIVINDNIPDGRDISWLWDVDFDQLAVPGVAITSGIRAADMALRLWYDQVAVKIVEPDIDKALTTFCDIPGDKTLFASYTAMLYIHAKLAKQTGSAS